MTNPVYKIETYTGAVLDHTIEHDALALYYKESATDNVGRFWFIVPAKKGSKYKYNDIALNDKIKIYLDYDTVGATPNFIGKVTKIIGSLDSQNGYIRRISGLSQGEILLRRFKTDKYYDGTGASTIVTELATDLSLGTGDIVADATAETHEVRTKRYFDFLQEISDYWYNAGTQVKKDFYVDIDDDLVWKARPIRTTGVETLAVGDNILDYAVTRDVDKVKNAITVYGQAEAPYPRDKDEWTEDTSNSDWSWSASVGSVSKSAVGTVKVGTYKIVGSSGAGGSQVTFKLDMPRINIRDINTLFFWWWAASVPPHSGEIRLFAPDSSNYFYKSSTPDGNWHWEELSLGPKHEYDAATNPNGTWSLNNSPNWWDIEYIEYDFQWSANDQNAWIDGMYFYPQRWEGTASSAASQSSYGQRDAEFTYDKLHSDNECERRAETLLYQNKNPIVQIEVTVPGNTNILVGDRLSMTIPAEGISAANYDVFTVEQFLNEGGFLTKAVMVDSADVRQPVENTYLHLLSSLYRRQKRLAEDMKLLR